MKSVQLFTVTALSLFFVTSCTSKSKETEQEFDVEVNHTTTETNAMPAGRTLDVEVVNELDPICGMTTAEHLKDTANYQGKTYGFCNTMCKEEFLKNPENHIHE